jgi:hypothetical protein
VKELSNDEAGEPQATDFMKDLIRKHLAAAIEPVIAELPTPDPLHTPVIGSILLDVLPIFVEQQDEVVALFLKSAIELAESLPEEESEPVRKLLLKCVQYFPSPGRDGTLWFSYLTLLTLLKRDLDCREAEYAAAPLPHSAPPSWDVDFHWPCHCGRRLR